MTQGTTDPRREAARILGRVLRDDAYANRMINAALQSSAWDPRDRALLTELVYGVIRHLYPLDHALDQVAKKGIKSIDPLVLNHLRVATYQLLYLDRVAPHAVLSEAVRHIRKQRGQRVANFANALLRSIQRDPDRFRPDASALTPEALALASSHPEWLVRRWLDRLGPARTQQRLAAHNQSAALVLRCHGPASLRDDALEALRQHDIDAEPTRWSPDGIRLTGPLPGPLHTFLQTFPFPLVPQDEAAQLVLHWLDPQDGESILDACAAPGGKTTHLAALAPQASITASDIHEHKIEIIRRACDALSLPTQDASQKATAPGTSGVTLLLHDATQPYPATYDRILCDAPCSGLGILRKQPEIRYRRSPDDIQEMAALQQNLLTNLATALRPGGVLLYSVCTDTPEENEQVLDAFLATHPEFSLDPTPPPDAPWASLLQDNGTLRTAPELHDMDAFFAARLRKTADAKS